MLFLWGKPLEDDLEIVHQQNRPASGSLGGLQKSLQYFARQRSSRSAPDNREVNLLHGVVDLPDGGLRSGAILFIGQRIKAVQPKFGKPIYRILLFAKTSGIKRAASCPLRSSAAIRPAATFFPCRAVRQ